MDIDRLVARATRAPDSQLAQAQRQRALRQIQDAYQSAVIAGIDVTAGLDLHDPLDADASEAAQIARAAHLAVLGRFTWLDGAEETTWSDELTTMLGYSAGSVQPTKGLLLKHVHPEDRDLVCQAISTARTDGQVVRRTYRMVRQDRSVLDVECHLEVLLDQQHNPCGVIGTSQDVSAREQARREVERLRRRFETVTTALKEWDSGSGLFTRRRFTDEVDRALRFDPGAVLILRVEPTDECLPAFLDGDYTDLVRVAARLLESVKEPGDQLGRVGLNELGVLLPGTNFVKAHRTAEYFIEALRTQDFLSVDGRVRAYAWGGLVRYAGTEHVSGEDLLIDAEIAWRQAKANNERLMAFAEPALSKDRHESCRERIAEALRTDQFFVHAQPILDLETNTIRRHELLLRVHDELNGLLPPTTLLGTAEHVDAVLDIDLWVLERAMDLLITAPRDQHLQVNISGRSLGDRRLIDRVEELMRRHQVNPGQLTFEITETAVIGNLTQARRFADRIHDLGCQLALDDFGSGHGSFRSLKLFPIDLVKIEGEFIENLPNSTQDQVMVQAIVQVCRAYGVRTLAEFVQDEATLELLRDFGVDMAQGYLIGRPQPVHSVVGPQRLWYKGRHTGAAPGTAPRQAVSW
jgi:PAS domain S-box-containing protein